MNDGDASRTRRPGVTFEAETLHSRAMDERRMAKSLRQAVTMDVFIWLLLPVVMVNGGRSATRDYVVSDEKTNYGEDESDGVKHCRMTR